MSDDSSLGRSLRACLDKRAAASTLRRLTVSGSSFVDFSSNDFLSLSTSDALRLEFLDEISKNPSFGIGSRGSRLLDGNSVFAEQLESEIAAFHGAPSGLLFNSGFDANSGLFSCVPQLGDVILYDELIHASVHEGMKLSRAGARLSFKHNCVNDLRRVLAACIQKDSLVRSGKRHVFIAVEAVYSMDGDLSPLAEVTDCVEQLLPLGNGYIVVDEAHSTGVFGPSGRGRVCELGLEKRVFARLHTFGKALGSGGAILLCSSLTRQYLLNYARSLIYTTSMSFPSLAAIRAAYNLLRRGEIIPLQARLQNLLQHLYTTLLTLDLTDKINGITLLRVPPECPKSPIFFVITPYPHSLANYCQKAGFMVRGIVPPTVPPGGERVRICLHAGNTVDEIDGLVGKIKEWYDWARVNDLSRLRQSSLKKSML
ncbi:MAG: hypothetical protein M1819_000948 [Sarea resinae]|nr:MAG: hypothetical protein M1819_000948 [Sarea resinae]